MGRLAWIMLMALAISTHALSIQPTNHLAQPRHKRDTLTNDDDSQLIAYLKFIIEKSELIGNLTTVVENQTKLLQQTKVEVNEQTKAMLEIISLPQDCLVWHDLGYTEDGVYTIWPLGESDEGVQVWCDMTTEGGGWTVFLKRQRQDNPVDFARTWQEYADGFGIASEEYWLGNRYLHALTKDRQQKLRVEVADIRGEMHYSEYESTTVGDEASKFAMKNRNFNRSSTMGDILAPPSSFDTYKFATFDQDNDNDDDINCSERRGRGGWWWRWGCGLMNPTAPLTTTTIFYMSTDGVTYHEAYTEFWAGPGIGSRVNLGWVQVKIRGT